MTFIASKAVGLIVIVAAIAVVALLWVQCQHGCVGAPKQKVLTTPTPTTVAAFGTQEVHIISPKQGAAVDSPMTIEGEAIPDWYIGGSFTMRLLDENGRGIAYTQVRPTSNTPVRGFIPFAATIPFFPHTQHGTIILEKNLGSGLPDFPSTIAMPISFLRVSQEIPTTLPEPTQTPAPSPSVSPAQTGIIQGHMTIGPICPTEQSGAACRPSLKMYAERVISIYKEDKTTLVAKMVPGPEGEFSQELAPGNYYVSMIPQIMGSITGVPTTVKIQAGKTVELNISVDTGIRTPDNTDTSSPDGF